jgi:hypothetical protein
VTLRFMERKHDSTVSGNPFHVTPDVPKYTTPAHIFAMVTLSEASLAVSASFVYREVRAAKTHLSNLGNAL